MRGEGFWGLKNPETQELPGALPPGPPLGRCPWAPPGALERAPGPHAVKTLRSLHSNWTQTICIQHPPVTNPAHAHGYTIHIIHFYFNSAYRILLCLISICFLYKILYRFTCLKVAFYVCNIIKSLHLSISS